MDSMLQVIQNEDGQLLDPLEGAVVGEKGMATGGKGGSDLESIREGEPVPASQIGSLSGGRFIERNEGNVCSRNDKIGEILLGLDQTLSNGNDQTFRQRNGGGDGRERTGVNPVE